MKTLIIKLGASGDVVRTTAILSELEGEVVWLTKKMNFDLLDGISDIDKIVFWEDINSSLEAKKYFQNQFYDCIISLDDELEVLQLVSNLDCNEFIGAFWNHATETPDYTNSSRGWFDMGLISKLGKQKADQLKFTNQKTFQSHLFEMLDLEFYGQKYHIGVSPNPNHLYQIGIEKTAGLRWPTKIWSGYDNLISELKSRNISYFVFQKRDTIRQYVEDINKCCHIVCGHTLAMHVGIALEKKVTGIFSPTPPHEIYDYGLLTKLYDSQAPCFCSYHSECSHRPRCIDRISLEQVLNNIN